MQLVYESPLTLLNGAGFGWPCSVGLESGVVLCVYYLLVPVIRVDGYL